MLIFAWKKNESERCGGKIYDPKKILTEVFDQLLIGNTAAPESQDWWSIHNCIICGSESRIWSCVRKLGKSQIDFHSSK